MTEKGSDELLHELDPTALYIMTVKLEADAEVWAEEQTRVEDQPATPDPGEDYPEREPVE